MAPLDTIGLREAIEQLANSLQAAILIAEHLERVSLATAEDATAINRNLRRVRAALQMLQPARDDQ